MPPAGGYRPNQFYPQLPPGYLRSTLRFCRLSNPDSDDPQMAPYWNGIWNGWIGYAGNQGYNPYDIGHFWTEYCPTQMGGNLYNFFNNNFYYWVTPQTSCSSCSTDPTTFWAAYIGFNFNSCDSCSY